MNESKILLDNQKAHQLSGNTLSLSGNTYVKNLQYLTNNNSNFNKLSVTDVNYVTGKTNTLLNKINSISGSTGLLSAGVVGNIDPILTDNGNGTATISPVQIVLYTTSDFTGYLHQYNVSGNTFSFIDGNEEYIAVNYNNGNPIMYKETNEANINGSNIKRLFTCWRQGTIIHSLNFDRIGLGLSNKLQIAEYHKAKYVRNDNGGLIISESSSPVNRTVIISESIVYTGAIHQDVLAFNSSIDILTESTVTNGIWSYSNVSIYNNSQYNPPTGPISLTGNKWSVRWFYRSIGDVKQSFYVLGDSQYNNQGDAELSMERTDLPILIRHHCILVGRALIQNGNATGYMESAFANLFTASQVINHNDTGNIQGGISGEYYHLKQANYLNLTGITSNIQNQINHISGVTNTKVNTTLFNTFTGNTQTVLFNKLDKSIFNNYSGITVPNTYYNKIQINQYTGQTQNNIFNKVNTTLFNNYTGATQTILNNKMNIVTGTTQNNVVIFGSNGTFADSGISKALIYAGLVM